VILLLWLGCAYTVQDYLDDVADAWCTCSSPGAQDECVDDLVLGWNDTEEWQSCQDEAAPATPTEMREWSKDYRESCRDADAAPPGGEVDDWLGECGG
jgi:hypothetical protein